MLKEEPVLIVVLYVGAFGFPAGPLLRMTVGTERYTRALMLCSSHPR